MPSEVQLMKAERGTIFRRWKTQLKTTSSAQPEPTINAICHHCRLNPKKVKPRTA